MHLERCQHTSGRRVQHAMPGDLITCRPKLVLKPEHIWRAVGEQLCTRLRHDGRVEPAAQTRLRQPIPGKQGSRVYFALRRDIAMSNDVFGRNVVATSDIFDQRNRALDLAVGVGRPLSMAIGVFLITAIHNFDADRVCVQP